MNIISWNVNSLRAIYKKEGFMDWFNNNDFDIIALQEVKAQLDQIPKELLKNDKYYSYFNPKFQSSYGGVGIFTKTKPLNVIKEIGNEKFDSDGRFLQLDFKNFTLINVCIPSAGSRSLDYKLEFYNVLIEYIINLKHKNIILCGDFNTAHTELDLAYPDKNKNKLGFKEIERENIDKILSLGFIDTFRYINPLKKEFSWYSYRARKNNLDTGWKLDYIFVNNDLKNNLKDAFILQDLNFSDHYPIGIKIKK